MISVIIPTLNEERWLARAIHSVRDPGISHEVLVVDGGSTDRTLQVARNQGVGILESSPGRAVQMNLGARRARGEVLLFLHADSRLPEGALGAVADCMSLSGTVGGKFRLRFDLRHPVLRAAGFLSRLAVPVTTYGDQGLFVHRTIFRELGGFEDVPIFEDQRFFARLRRKGSVRVLPLEVTTSGRRFEARGPIRQTLTNLGLIAAHGLGVGPRRLASHYRQGAEPRV